MSAYDPGCVKTASECSRRDFLWILKIPASIKSITYQTATTKNWPTSPRIVVFAGVFTQPGPIADIDVGRLDCDFGNSTWLIQAFRADILPPPIRVSLLRSSRLFHIPR